MSIVKNDKKSGIVNDLKNKAIDWIIDYSKQKINESKTEIVNYVEKQIERKVKREVKRQVRRYSFMVGAFFLFALGGLILVYSFFELFFYLLNLPDVFLNLSYALFILIVGTVVYLNID